MNVEFEEAPELEATAQKLVDKFPYFEHVNIDEILFLNDMVGRPRNVLARCYFVGDHPIQFYTDKQYVIVFYSQNIDFMTENQRTLLLYHEMRHIGRGARKLVDHTVKDFRFLLGINIDWNSEGVEVPNILEEEI